MPITKQETIMQPSFYYIITIIKSCCYLLGLHILILTNISKVVFAKDQTEDSDNKDQADLHEDQRVEQRPKKRLMVRFKKGA